VIGLEADENLKLNVGVALPIVDIAPAVAR